VKKVFLPKWIPWFILLIAVMSITFSFFQIDEKGVENFVYILLLLGTVVFVMFLITYRQIPYLLIEEG